MQFNLAKTRFVYGCEGSLPKNKESLVKKEIIGAFNDMGFNATITGSFYDQDEENHKFSVSVDGDFPGSSMQELDDALTSATEKMGLFCNFEDEWDEE